MDRYHRVIKVIVLILLLLLLSYVLMILYPFYRHLLKFIGKLIFPFVFAIFLSYIIHPLVAYLRRRWKWHPAFAVGMIFLIGVATFGIILYKSVPVFIRELEELSEQLPELIAAYEQGILMLYESTAFLPEAVHDKMDIFINGLEQRIDDKITWLLEGLFQSGEYAIWIVVVPVLAFYFMKDKEEIIAWFRERLPKKWRNHYARVLTAIDASLGNYMRGQLMLSIAVMMITYLFYHILGLKYAFLLAIFTGVMNVVPYFGPLIGTVPAVLITATVSVRLVVFVLLANALVQLIESSLLSPYIMGKNVHIHPIALIFLLLFGGEIGGVIGIILIIPTATIVWGIYRELTHR